MDARARVASDALRQLAGNNLPQRCGRSLTEPPRPVSAGSETLAERGARPGRIGCFKRAWANRPFGLKHRRPTRFCHRRETQRTQPRCGTSDVLLLIQRVTSRLRLMVAPIGHGRKDASCLRRPGFGWKKRLVRAIATTYSRGRTAPVRPV